MNILSPGFIAGLLALGSAIAVAFHHPALGAFLDDPKTAESATMVLTGLMALFAGGLRGIRADAAASPPTGGPKA
jgi:hypothetical protein